MIRRAFWLGAGAAAGIMGYRRVCAVGRKLNATVAGGAASRTAGRTSRSALGMAREAARFTRDVREGMDLYMARHNEPAASTLRAQHRRQVEQRHVEQRHVEHRHIEQKDGR